MYGDKLFPWDEYPKFLSFEEVQHPFGVVSNYFDGTLPEDRSRELIEWRSYVISHKHYRHPHGPGNLLFISDEHLRLLEACYLLFAACSQYWLRNTALLSAEALETARKEWSYFPNNLSAKELSNPYRALKKIFRKYSLAQYRVYLKEWLHAALYKNPIDESMTAGEIEAVYANMQRLGSAAWMILQAESDCPKFTGEPEPKHEVERNEMQIKSPYGEIAKNEENIDSLKAGLADSVARDGGIKPFAPKISPAEQMGLDEVVALIRKEMPSVRMINYLGSYQDPFTFYLLILVDDAEKMPEHSIVNKIEDNCRRLVAVYAIVHKMQSAVKGLKKGGRFWKASLEKGICLYKGDGVKLPEPLAVTDKEEYSAVLAQWERWGKLGYDFFGGAVYYIEKKNYQLGIFMLHQAAECTLIGLIKVIFGYRQSVHSLTRLLKLTLLFTDELMEIFDPQDSDKSKVFSLLSAAYGEARYKEAFNPEADLVISAQYKVELLIAKAKLICLKVIDGKKC
ncbi:HEPN domain-containing protein [Inquilinus sp. KBS0705]|nr:HEPN domain-containing protein [Inquilinus sp. KBS0705]